jgi:hypothetical protein
MRILALLWFASSVAVAQTVTPLPPQGGLVLDRVANVHAVSQIDSALFARTLVQQGNNNAFDWNIFGVLDNYGDAGENVGLYVKANQYGQGATWAGVFESQCISLVSSTCWGLEVDLMAPEGGQTKGYGVGVVVGRANPLSPIRDPADHRVAHALNGFFVNANFADAPYVDIAVAYDTQIHCTIACFRMPGGEAMAYELSGRVVQKFDPQTGYAGWWRTDLGECIWCVNMTNGDVRRMWRP